MLIFQPLSLDMSETYEKFYQLCDEKCADYTFINLWIWNDKYKYELAFDDDLCWISSRDKKGQQLRCPIGNWHQTDWLERFEPLYNNGIRLYRIPQLLSQMISRQYPGKTETHDDRDNWEYIYKTSDLIDLRGQKLRNKRKSLNQFREQNDYEYIPLTSKELPSILNFHETWLQQPELEINKGFAAEFNALNRLLENWDVFCDKLVGGALHVGSEMVAYLIAEVIDSQNITVHFEKALYNYKGAYPAINQIFLSQNRRFKYVNRQQDLGEAGLRKSKMEYRPVRFIKKDDFFCCLPH